MSKKILMATSNLHKFTELQTILKPYNIELLSLNMFDNKLTIEENGYTFKENALIKARAAYNLYALPTIADDSGISIHYFNNYPSVHSARFLDEYGYPLKNELILEIMQDIKNRYAFYSCAIAYIENNQEYLFEDILEGEIAQKQMGDNGFGYDPIFYYPPLKSTLAQLSADDKNNISHRGKAIRKLVNFFASK